MRKHIRIEWAGLPSSASSRCLFALKRGDAQGGNEKYKKPQLRLFFHAANNARPVCSISLDTSSTPMAYIDWWNFALSFAFCVALPEKAKGLQCHFALLLLLWHVSVNVILVFGSGGLKRKDKIFCPIEDEEWKDSSYWNRSRSLHNTILPGGSRLFVWMPGSSTAVEKEGG